MNDATKFPTKQENLVFGSICDLHAWMRAFDAINSLSDKLIAKKWRPGKDQKDTVESRKKIRNAAYKDQMNLLWWCRKLQHRQHCSKSFSRRSNLCSNYRRRSRPHPRHSHPSHWHQRGYSPQPRKISSQRICHGKEVGGVVPLVPHARYSPSAVSSRVGINSSVKPSSELFL